MPERTQTLGLESISLPPYDFESKAGERAKIARDGLAMIRRISPAFPVSAFASLCDSVRQHSRGLPEHPKATLLTGIFDTRNLSSVVMELERAEILPGELPHFMRDPDMMALTSSMLDAPEAYKDPLSVLLSVFNLNNLPEELQQKVAVSRTDLPFTFEPKHGKWWLCSTAEERLEKAIDQKVVMAIGESDDPYLLLKMRGEMTALCLKTVANAEGDLLVAGNWYSPTDSETRAKLKDAFVNDQGQFPLEGSWALQRPLLNYTPAQTKTEREKDALFVKARAAAQALPSKYPDTFVIIDVKKQTKQTRAEFLEAQKAIKLQI